LIDPIFMKKLDIAIVDDHTLFRQGLSAALSSAKIINRIFEASNGEEFLELIKTQTPDVVLMDISMPVLDGIEATRIAVSGNNQLKIIALSMHNDIEHFQDMIEAGVVGFLSKDSALEDVSAAIESVANGNKVFSQDLMYSLVRKMNKEKSQTDLITEREREILQRVSSGKSNNEIAAELNISKRTVDKHRENILAKTQTKNTAELIMFALKNKLI